MATKTTYHAFGAVRRSCGHKHRTIETAARCVLRDSRACRALGGGAYSDRTVQRTDGEPLTRDEQQEVEEIFFDLT